MEKAPDFLIGFLHGETGVPDMYCGHYRENGEVYLLDESNFSFIGNFTDLQGAMYFVEKMMRHKKIELVDL